MRDREILRSLKAYEEETNLELEAVLKETSKIKTPDWTMKDLDNVLKKLESKQSQDMKGYVNELFHVKNIGFDLKQSLLIIFNRIKQNVKIPKSINQAYIKSIPKKKKDPMSL